MYATEKEINEAWEEMQKLGTDGSSVGLDFYINKYPAGTFRYWMAFYKNPDNHFFSTSVLDHKTPMEAVKALKLKVENNDYV